MADRFAEIFLHANEAMYLIDPERDRVLDANTKVCYLLGYSREEIVQIPISAIHPKDMSKLLTFVRSECSPGSDWTDQLDCLTRNGVRLHAEFSGAMLNLDSRPCL